MGKTRSLSRRHAEVENISILGHTERLAPLGLWVYASGYLKAARMLPADRELGVHIPRAYLICHAVELALKAYLSIAAHQTLAQFSQSSSGHNLEHWLQEAEAAGLSTHVSLTAGEKTAIRDWSERHRGKVLSYPAILAALKGLYDDASLETLEGAADALIQGLDSYCKQPIPPIARM